MLVAATESDTEAAVVRGYDVENILLGDGSAADFIGTEAAQLAKKLVEEEVLVPFCSSCSFVYRVDKVYRVNIDHRLVKEAQMMSAGGEKEEVNSQTGNERCRGHFWWFQYSAFQDLLEQFDRQEGISGTDGVQALLRFGAYSVPTALALANELLHHEFIAQCSSGGDGIPYRMNTSARYKKVCAEILPDNINDVKKRHAIVSSERATQDQRRLEAQVQKLKEKYKRIFNLFCVCCLLVLLDALVTT
eukprot:jgi/Phyca11/69708/gw1.30.426.1